MATLLDSLREVGADQQVAVLAARAAACAPLDDPTAVASLLGSLQEVGAEEQVTTLLARDPAAHSSLNNRLDMVRLLGSLQQAGADQQIKTLIARLPAAGMLDMFQVCTGLRFWFGREPDGRQADAWGWDDLA